MVKNGLLPSHLMPNRLLFHNKWRVQAKNSQFIAKKSIMMVTFYFPSLFLSFIAKKSIMILVLIGILNK
jgi:hypothetical protein